MTTQLDLLAATPAARGTDPVSSHEAAEHVTEIGQRAAQQQMVLRGFTKWPGLTTRELAAKLNVCRYVVGRRAPELHPVYLERGMMRRCTITGRLAQTWYPTGAAMAKAGEKKAA